MNENRLEDFSRETIEAMPWEAWLLAAWHASISGIVSGPVRLVSTKRGIWVAVCSQVRDIVLLTDNDEVIYRLRRLDTIRPLAPLKSIYPVPQDVSPSQSHRYPLMHEAYRAVSKRDDHHGDTMILTMLRGLPLQKMPLNAWHQLAWRVATEPSVSAHTQVLSVSRGIWRIACFTQESYDKLANSAKVIATLNWLSRYRRIDARRIERELGHQFET